MAYYPRTQPKRPWFNRVRLILVIVIVLTLAWGLSRLTYRLLHLKALSVQEVRITGCSPKRQVEIQKLSEDLSLGQPLLWFNAEPLMKALMDKPWIQSINLSKDPPDRLVVIVDEKEPYLWMVNAQGVYLVSEGGILMDELNSTNGLKPLPIVSDTNLQNPASLARLCRVAKSIKSQQPEFFDLIEEFHWDDQGPVLYLQDFQAPIKLDERDPLVNIPNFQSVFTSQLSTPAERAGVETVNLRFKNQVILTLKNKTGVPTIIDGDLLPRKR
ncbi:MAG: cell division protein FtsQ/DivIB [Holophagaceae bacterium]